MKRYVWIVNPTVNNSCFIIALVAVSVLVTEGNVPGNVSGNVSISECPQSGGQAQRQGHIPDDGQPVNFTCDNIPANEKLYWVLRPNSTVTVSLTCDSPSQPCTPNNPDFQVSRGYETSVLTVVHNHQRWLVTGTVVCAVGDGTSNWYTCNVKFASTAVTTHGTATTDSASAIPPPATRPEVSLFSTATTHGYTRAQLEETTDHDPFPSAAVGGGVAAAVVVVIVVVVVVIFLCYKKRRFQRSDKPKQTTAVESEVHENSAVTDDSANDASAKSQYASLQMSEVGLRSLYSDFAHRSTATQAQPGQPGDYASLPMSDVGMTSTYSELGQHGGVAPAHGGTDYEVPP